MIQIGKIFRFEAAHSLPHHKGKCKHLHGHRWELEVRITGRVKIGKNAEENGNIGMIMDFGDLKKAVQHIIDSHDHRHLNDVYANPTAETMVEAIAEKIEALLPNDATTLDMIKLWESEDNYAIWRP